MIKDNKMSIDAKSPVAAYTIIIRYVQHSINI